MQCRFVGSLQPAVHLSHHFFPGQMIKFSGFKKCSSNNFSMRGEFNHFHGFWLGFGSVLSTGVFSDKISLAALFTSTFRFFKHLFVDTRRLRYLPTFNYPWFFAPPPFVHQTFANAKPAPRVIILLSWPIVSGSLSP